MRVSLFLFLLTLSACGAPSITDAGVDAGTPDAGLTTFQQALLDTHNQIRANAMPAPSPALPRMEWRLTAQALAEDPCLHYTQIVWRSSVGLGCAQQRCTTNSPFGNGEWFFVVCNYDPAGNFVGQRPY